MAMKVMTIFVKCESLKLLALGTSCTSQTTKHLASFIVWALINSAVDYHLAKTIPMDVSINMEKTLNCKRYNVAYVPTPTALFWTIQFCFTKLALLQCHHISHFTSVAPFTANSPILSLQSLNQLFNPKGPFHLHFLFHLTPSPLQVTELPTLPSWNYKTHQQL
jgi:hypothetical protein